MGFFRGEAPVGAWVLVIPLPGSQLGAKLSPGEERPGRGCSGQCPAPALPLSYDAPQLQSSCVWQSHVEAKSDAFAGTAKGISRYLKTLPESSFRYRKISKQNKGCKVRKGVLGASRISTRIHD